MKFKGWIKVTLSYDIDASSIIEAEIEVRSAVNRIKNQGNIVGNPQVIDWGVEVDSSSEDAE